MKTLPSHLWLVTLLIAWAFDFLFWGIVPGISFVVAVALVLAGGLYLAWRAGLRPPVASLSLVLPIGFFAGMSFVRAEPATRLLNFGLALGLMGLLACTFLGGRWAVYTSVDYALNALSLAWSALARGWQPLQEAWRARNSAGQVVRRRRLVPVLRGAGLALPVVFFFGTLLASADPVFSHYLANLLPFSFDNLAEYAFRVMLILTLAYFLAGAYLHAFVASRSEVLTGAEKLGLAPVLGFVEAAVVLASVDALFAAFVAVQFRYFFGGRANVAVDGFTYAEYARRGFSELVVVALFSLLLLLGAGAVTRRPTRQERMSFSLLGVVLVVLVIVILASAYQRLLLYEYAYGFSRIRTYVHVFMVWLGLLLAAVAAMEVSGRLRQFALAALVAALGFGVSLNLLDVDATIARLNVARAAAGAELDMGHLLTLSDDAVAVLAARFRDLPSPVRDQVGATLACRAAMPGEGAASRPWQSQHLSTSRAQADLVALRADLAAYPVHWGPASAPGSRGASWVWIDGQERLCFSTFERRS